MADIGNLTLARKLNYSGSVDLFRKLLEKIKERRRKRRAARRQRKHRLKGEEIALVPDKIDTIEKRLIRYVESDP